MIVERTPYSDPYHPTKETVEFFIWLTSLVNEENKPAPAHFQMIDHINRRNRFKLVECSRGLSKTTLIGIYSTLYWAWKGHKQGFGEVSYILYIMESVNNVAANIEQIAMLLGYFNKEDGIPELMRVLEVKKLRLGDDPTLYLYHKEKKRNLYIKGRGSGQAMRGTRIGGERPNIIILDDIESEKTIATKELREKLKAWFFGAVVPAANPSRYEIIMIGTPLHEDSLLVNALESKKWSCIQLPVSEKFPCKKDEFVSAWPDRFTYEYVNETYQMYDELGKKTLWYQEYMLEIAPAEGLVFDMDKINKYEQAKMRDKLGSLTYYVTCDIAISEKEYADYTSIAVIGVDGESGDWFIVDGVYGRWGVNDTVDKTFWFVKRYRPYAVLFENVAFQMAMEQILRNEMIRRGTFFNLEMVKRTAQMHKISVIKALEPIVTMGKFWVPTDYANGFVEELLHEMSLTTQETVRSKHDDVLDSVAMLTLVPIVATAPARESPMFQMEAQANPYVF